MKERQYLNHFVKKVVEKDETKSKKESGKESEKKCQMASNSEGDTVSPRGPDMQGELVWNFHDSYSAAAVTSFSTT